jgi:hypothetical protein
MQNNMYLKRWTYIVTKTKFFADVKNKCVWVLLGFRVYALLCK